MTHAMHTAKTLLLVATTISFCSCQSLQTKPSQQTAQRPPVQQASANIPQPAPGRPVVTPGYYPPAAPYAAQVAMMPRPHAHAHRPSCPCCGPKQPFTFSDPCDSCGPGGNGACGHGGACGDGQCEHRPYDEYICDGGDNAPNVRVRRDWAVFGLDQEDTIVHFDTIRGDTEWTASNKVCIYAPRFAAVRQVTGMEAREQADRLALADKALPPSQDRDLRIVTNLNQPLQPSIDLGIKQAESLLEKQKGLTAETTRQLHMARLELLPYENLEVIRSGAVQAGEKPRLAQVASNAAVWTRNQAVQVVIDGKLPLEAVKDVLPGETVMYDLQGKPRMRIIKIADKSEAQIGDIVSFTLRFDNVGDQKVGKVTIIDNLTTRLEYIEDSQECSHKAKFHTTPNDGETLTLRWEIEDPMRVGEGGIIRFKCRVR